MVNPGKLKALVDSHSAGPGMAALNNPAMVEDPDADLEDDDFDDEEPSQDDADTSMDGNAMIASWGVLGAHLKEEAGEIVDGAHEVGSDLLLAKIPQDALDEVEKSFDRMPEEIQQALAKYVSKLSPEQCDALAGALIDGHDGDTKEADTKLVSIYLQQISKYAADEVDPADYEDEEEEDDEDDGSDDADQTPDEGEGADGGGAGDGQY